MSDVVRVIRQPSRVVKVVEPGEIGPTGPPGDSREQNFPVAALTWTFVHNLGYPPAVMLYDPMGVAIPGRIESNDETTTVVTWYHPQAGSISVS